ncbi:MAG: methyltransferase domain-containing protein [Endomicrobia bacterium]|nr:methyltransferase domain-containing protein [Endomicrobiia bacterium]
MNVIKRFLWQWPEGLIWQLTEKFTLRSRKQKYQIFLRFCKPKREDKILDIGVSPFFGRGTNFLELWYPHKENITALTNENIEKFCTFRKHFPEVKLLYGDGKNLPFPDNYFDIVFSNAVLEHIGSREDQKKFIREVVRVSKKFFVTTPNYWFPVDSHTLIPFAHWLPTRLKSFIYRKLNREYWADEKNLNLLSVKELVSLFPKNLRLIFYKQKFLFFTTTLIVIGEKYYGSSNNNNI